MPVQSIQEMSAKLLELCSEDDYGSWELWWDVSAEIPADQAPKLKKEFTDLVSELVSAGKLIPKCHSADGNFAPTQFDREKLVREIDSAANPDPDSFFWFGTE